MSLETPSSESTPTYCQYQSTIYSHVLVHTILLNYTACRWRCNNILCWQQISWPFRLPPRSYCSSPWVDFAFLVWESSSRWKSDEQIMSVAFSQRAWEVIPDDPRCSACNITHGLRVASCGLWLRMFFKILHLFGFFNLMSLLRQMPALNTCFDSVVSTWCLLLPVYCSGCLACSAAVVGASRWGSCRHSSLPANASHRKRERERESMFVDVLAISFPHSWLSWHLVVFEPLDPVWVGKKVGLPWKECELAKTRIRNCRIMNWS